MENKFILTGRLEGLSFLLLLLVGMPLKYIWGFPWANKIIGLAHGVLFMAYIYQALQLGTEKKWPRSKTWASFLAALLPLGTFIFEKKYLSSKYLSSEANKTNKTK